RVVEAPSLPLQQLVEEVSLLLGVAQGGPAVVGDEDPAPLGVEPAARARVEGDERQERRTPGPGAGRIDTAPVEDLAHTRAQLGLCHRGHCRMVYAGAGVA